MSYVDYNYTNLLGGLCKEAVKVRKGKVTHVNYGDAINIGGRWVNGFPKVRWQFDFVDDLRRLCDKLETAEPADIPELQQQLNVIKNRLREANEGEPFSKDTQAFFRKLREDIAKKYPEEVVLEAQAAQLRAQAAEQARRERAKAYGPELKAIAAKREARGGAYTPEEVDDIIRIRSEIGQDEDWIQLILDGYRQDGLLPEGYQMPPKDVPPAAETTPSARPSPDTSLLGRANLTADDIRGASDAALEALVNSFRPSAAAQSPPALNTAETFAIMEQRHRFLKANNEEAAKELERTFRLPPRDAYTPANGRPNINGDNSREKIVITPEEAGVTNGGEIPTR